MMQPDSATIQRPFPWVETLASGIAIILIMMVGLAFIALGYFFAWSWLNHVPATITTYRLSGRDIFSMGVLMGIQAIGYIPVIGFVVWRLPTLARASLFHLGFRPPTWQQVLIGFAGTIGALWASSIVQAASQILTHAEAHQETLKIITNLHGKDLTLAIITACVFAPIAEEIVFRGFVYNALASYMRPSWAIVASGIIFAFAHGQLDIVPGLAAAGMVFALVYQRTTCIWSDIISHATFNAFSLFAIFVLHAAS